jgi:hypothetical protein
VVPWTCDFTADGLAGISNFGLFSFQVCEEEHFAYLLFQLNIFWVPQKGVALFHPQPRQSLHEANSSPARGLLELHHQFTSSAQPIEPD